MDCRILGTFSGHATPPMPYLAMTLSLSSVASGGKSSTAGGTRRPCGSQGTLGITALEHSADTARKARDLSSSITRSIRPGRTWQQGKSWLQPLLLAQSLSMTGAQRRGALGDSKSTHCIDGGIDNALL